MPCLVLLETSGNQHFIFATNKLAENLGASQMIWDAGVTLALSQIQQLTGKSLHGATLRETRANLRGQAPLSDNPGDIEVVTAASGKTILLVNNKEVGRDLVYALTSRCLRELPGVELRGVVGRDFDMPTADLDREMRAVHETLAALAGTFPGADFRFLRLPIAAPCGTSNLPAAMLDKGAPDGPQLRSAVSDCKRSTGEVARKRFEGVLDLGNASFRLPKNLEEMESLQDRVGWLAVIHADGNGVGAIFQNFGKCADAQGREYINKLRNFSLALDECTETALRKALEKAYARLEPTDKTLPVVPLVLGGDDLTMLCEGRIALRTAHDFLAGFADSAAANDDIQAVARKTGNPITASAGVAIIKPHFPFHLAYELAERLLDSAKRRLKRKPALDFLVHYDASGGDLRQIRDRLRVLDAQLYARPYPIEAAGWEAFAKALGTLNGEDGSEEDDAIPRSLLHELRSAIFLGRDAGERQLEWALRRRGAGDKRLRDMLASLHGNPCLFEANPEKADPVRDADKPDWRSKLLDVLEAREFWA